MVHVCAAQAIKGLRDVRGFIITIIYIRQSQQTEVFLLGALNDYEDA